MFANLVFRIAFRLGKWHSTYTEEDGWYECNIWPLQFYAEADVWHDYVELSIFGKRVYHNSMF